MLRIGYLPSDFHPLVLILGEGADLADLARTLRGFADGGADLALDGEGRTGIGVTLSRRGEPGMRVAGAGAFLWCLQPEQAHGFAAILERLAGPETVAGSEHLETGTAGELPVKASLGEYTDDFLLEEDAPAAV